MKALTIKLLRAVNVLDGELWSFPTPNTSLVERRGHKGDAGGLLPGGMTLAQAWQQELDQQELGQVVHLQVGLKVVDGHSA